MKISLYQKMSKMDINSPILRIGAGADAISTYVPNFHRPTMTERHPAPRNDFANP